MELKTEALLLRAVDYGENDRMATLLTAGRGKIGVRMKGVKKAGAKLKFAAQPFCFAEYVLAEKGGRYTATGASLYDGFYALREDVNAYYAACAVCEGCDRLLYEGMPGGDLLVAAVTALKEMCAGSVSSALIRFLLRALSLAGYPVRAGVCPHCGQWIIARGRLRFDMERGSFVCGSCTTGAPASAATLYIIRKELSAAAETLPGEAAKEEEPSFTEENIRDGQRRALRLLSAYFSYQTETELPALAEYIRMI